MLYYKLFLPL